MPKEAPSVIQMTPDPTVTIRRQEPPPAKDPEEKPNEEKPESPEELEARTKAVMDGLGLTYTPKEKKEEPKSEEQPKAEERQSDSKTGSKAGE